MEEVNSQRNIFDKFKKWVSRVDVKCLQCSNIYKADKDGVEKFLEVQKNNGIEEAVKLQTGILCPKCKANRWALMPKKKFEWKFKLDLGGVKKSIGGVYISISDTLLWALAWLEYRREILVRNWWFDYKNVICRGGALIGLMVVVYYVRQVFKIEFYQAGLSILLFYAVMKFSKN